MSCPLAEYVVQDYAVPTHESAQFCADGCPTTYLPAYMLSDLKDCKPLPSCATADYASPCSHYFVQSNLSLPVMLNCDPRSNTAHKQTSSSVCRDPALFVQGKPPPEESVVHITVWKNDLSGVWKRAFGSKNQIDDIFIHSGEWNFGNTEASVTASKSGNSSFAIKVRTDPSMGDVSLNPPKIIFSYSVKAPTHQVKTPGDISELKKRTGLRFRQDGHVKLDYVSGDNIVGAFESKMDWGKESMLSWEFIVPEFNPASIYSVKIQAAILYNATVIPIPHSLLGGFPIFGYVLVAFAALAGLGICLFGFLKRKGGILDNQGSYGNLIPKDTRFETFPGQETESYSMELRRYGVTSEEEGFAFLDEEETIQLTPNLP